MEFKALPTVTVIKKEEKEAKLKAFIGDHLARRADKAGGLASDRVYLLIARSHESPVVRALSHAIAESGSGDVALKALILVPGSQLENIWPANLADVTDGRTTSDLRLLEAHEQLWLDGETVWIGDCMRREPAKRDAYECYANGCEATARFAEASFNRLWDKGSPILVDAAEPAQSDAPEMDPHLAQVAPADGVAPTVSTRH